MGAKNVLCRFVRFISNDVAGAPFSLFSTESHKIIARNQKGLSLMELMIVIAIIGILSVAGTMTFIIARDKARVSACMITMDSIMDGLELYVSDYTLYPDSSEITTLADAREVLEGSIDFSTQTTCEDPLNYTTTGTAYRMETTVHFTGAPGLGVKIIIENGELREEELI